RPALPGLEHPLEPDRVVFGHVRAHDHDAVGVLEILLEVRRAASSERGPQTGDRGAVSYARLVLDLHDPERDAKLLDQVVLLVVERRAAEVADCHRAVRGRAVVGQLFPVGRAGLDDPVDDHLHRFVERELLPARAVRPAVLDLVLAQRAPDIRLRGLSLRAEAAARDRAGGVALDVLDLAVLDVDELPAADRAVGTDRLNNVVGLLDAGAQGFGAPRLRGLREPERVAFPDLSHKRPPGQRIPELHAPPSLPKREESKELAWRSTARACGPNPARRVGGSGPPRRSA